MTTNTNTRLTASRIYRSRDGGAHWEASGAELPGCNVRDLRIDPVSPQAIYRRRGLTRVSAEAVSLPMHGLCAKKYVRFLTYEEKRKKTVQLTAC